MTDQELDTLMRRVLLDALKLDAESTVGGEQTFAATPRYRRQMAAMVQAPLKWARRRARPAWKRVLQKAAMILLVFSLSLGSLMAVSPTVRAAVVRWVVEWYETSCETNITYRYSGEQIDGEMPLYEIMDLPEGYVEDESERIEWPHYTSFTYYNPNKENDQGIILDYIYMAQGAAANFLIDDDDEIIPVTVNGLEGQLFLAKDWENRRSVLTWIDPENNIQLSIMAAMDADSILHIAESVSLVKTEK